MIYTIHPACAKWPGLSEADFAALVADIKARGLIDPIWLTEAGEILEGKLRFNACSLAGVEPRFETYRGDDPIGFTISRNKLRRHMTLAQLAFIGEELAKLKAHRPDNYARERSNSQGEIAQQLGIDKRAISDARAIKEHGEFNIIELAKTGQVGLKNAAAFARHTPRDAQRNADRKTVKHQGNQLRTPLKNKKKKTPNLKFSPDQLQELNEKLRPLIKRLRFQSKQHITLLCPYELECIAFEIDAFLKGWANTEATAVSQAPAASIPLCLVIMR